MSKQKGDESAFGVAAGSPPRFRVFRTHEGARKYMAHFAIGHQSFCINGSRTLSESMWLERQLETALARLVADAPNT